MSVRRWNPLFANWLPASAYFGALDLCFWGAKLQVTFGSSVCGTSEKYCWNGKLFLSRSQIHPNISWDQSKWAYELQETGKQRVLLRASLDYRSAQLPGLYFDSFLTNAYAFCGATIPFLQLLGCFQKVQVEINLQTLNTSSLCYVQVSLAGTWWSPLGLAPSRALYSGLSNPSCKNNKIQRKRLDK